MLRAIGSSDAAVAETTSVAVPEAGALRVRPHAGTGHGAASRSGRSTAKGGAKGRRPLLVGGVICLLAGVIVALVFSNTSPRLPGNTGSGGVTLSQGQQDQRELAQAATLEEEGQYTEALQLYQQVLSQDPGNPGALSEAGWLEFEAGVLGGSQTSLEQGEANEESAVKIEPGLPTAHAYLGSMYFVEGEVAQAVVQYSHYLADGPTAAEMSPFLPDIRKAFSETKTPLPSIAAQTPATQTPAAQTPVTQTPVTQKPAVKKKTAAKSSSGP